jgi:hypothetical protein
MHGCYQDGLGTRALGFASRPCSTGSLGATGKLPAHKGSGRRLPEGCPLSMTGSTVACLVASLVALYLSGSILLGATGTRLANRRGQDCRAFQAAPPHPDRPWFIAAGPRQLVPLCWAAAKTLAAGPASALGWPWASRISASRACSRTRYRLRLVASSMAVISLQGLWGSSSACSHRSPWACAPRLPSPWLLVLAVRWVLAL